jgi:glycerol-3-phosphate cytidylyltransferase-like family protein
MFLSPDKGRAAITSTIDYIKKIYDVAPMSVALSMFKDAKLDELVNVYSKASSTEREKVYELLYAVYPTETDRLDKIKKGQIK